MYENMAYNSETTRGLDLPPFLINNPDIRGIEAMTTQQVPLFFLESQPEKKCTKCGEEKLPSEFGKYLLVKSGLTAQCKFCTMVYQKAYRIANKDVLKQKKALYYKKNRVHALNQSKKHYEEHIEEKKEYAKQYRKETDYEKNYKERRNFLVRKRFKENPRVRVSRAFSSSIKQALFNGAKGKNKWQDIVGYNAEELRRHLKRLFQHGMTWDNYGEWHIDHKIPISAFNYEKPGDIDFKRCWALSNLRPMWAKDNISKGSSLDKPFQPAFIFG